jgi:tetratricopeptide (TPR) repeat protein
LGFFLLVILAALILFGMLRGLLNGDDNLPLVLGCIALLVHMGLDIDASYPALLGLAALLAGLVYSQGKTVVGPLSWRVSAAAVLLLIPVIPYYQGSVLASRAASYQADGDLTSASQFYGRSHQGLLFDPDWVNGEGIALYAQATGAAPGQRAQLASLALDRAHQAQKQDSKDGQHHQLEGRILALQGDYPGAESALKRALVLDPFNHPDYAYDLARIQALEGKSTIALQTATEMLALYPQQVITNRSADTSLRPALVGLATFVGTRQLADGNLTAARQAAKMAAMYDPKDFRTKALQNALDKAAGGSSGIPNTPL